MQVAVTIQLPVELGGAGGACVFLGACLQVLSALHYLGARKPEQHACRHRRVTEGNKGAAGGRAALTADFFLAASRSGMHLSTRSLCSE